MITATNLAERFNVSIRTIYRDIRALEQAGVPIIVEDGKGYTLMEGYKIPPIMFSENQANALILAEQLVLKNTDSSFIKDYSDAIDKLKQFYDNQRKTKQISSQIELVSNRT
jgi:predicted DNA-binding transcriptional regulator YafY